MRIAPYRVKCHKRDNPVVKIVFYQNSPSFKGNIDKEIKVIVHE